MALRFAATCFIDPGPVPDKVRSRRPVCRSDCGCPRLGDGPVWLSSGIAQPVAGVRGGTLDAAITRPPLVDDLDSDMLGSEGVVIALPDGHRLAGRDACG